MAQSAFRIEGLNRLLYRIRQQSGNVVNKELMSEIGHYVVNEILDRTAKGKDVDGNDFEPYSPKYRLFRIKHGRQTDKVNLFWHGTMTSALTHTAFKEKVKIFFMKTYGKDPYGKASKVSSPEKAFFLNQKREFFALSEEDYNAIREMINEHLNRLLNGEV